MKDCKVGPCSQSVLSPSQTAVKPQPKKKSLSQNSLPNQANPSKTKVELLRLRKRYQECPNLRCHCCYRTQMSVFNSHAFIWKKNERVPFCFPDTKLQGAFPYVKQEEVRTTAHRGGERSGECQSRAPRLPPQQIQ